MKPLLAILLSVVVLSATAQEGWELYHAPGENAAELARKLQPLLPQGVTLQAVRLPATCDTPQEAELQSRAIAAGVQALPCLVLRDAKGPYAALPLNGLKATTVAAARNLAHATDRESAAYRRRLIARVFELRYALSRSADTAEQDRIIARMQELIQHADTPTDVRQLVGLHCIYPALMQQYTAEYRGSHTPRTEAKLLEAIRALEAARDADPSSQLGRRAYSEREKLRAARLKSRQYE